MRILWLAEPDSRLTELVGGKAANLARLLETYPVPPGFCISAFRPDLDWPCAASVGEDIRCAYMRLGKELKISNPPVAVRSSAIDEDGAVSSFAGAHDTFLNVRGLSALMDTIGACARSAVSDRASAYREARGVPNGDIKIAVLVQQMIGAEASFVAFSRNPVSSNERELLINAGWGIGKPIVDGSIIPETYVVRRSDRAITQRVGGQQAFETVLAENGTSDRELPVARRRTFSLDEVDVAAISDLVTGLEQRFGIPVDIEGARTGRKLYLLQCRPATGAFPVQWENDQDRRGTWLREDIHFPGVVTPMGGEYAVRGMYAGLRRLQEQQEWPSRAEARIFNGYVYVNWLYLLTLDDLQIARQDLAAANLRRAHTIVTEWNESIWPRLQAIYESIDVAVADGIWRLLEEAWTLHFLLLYPCMAAIRNLESICTELFGVEGHEHARRLTQGSIDRIHRVEADLFDLGAQTGQDFDAALLRFLGQHGHLGAETDDIAAPTWKDDPKKLLAEISALRKSGDSPQDRVRQLIADGNELLIRLNNLLHNRPNDRARLSDAVALARSAGPLTEDHNYWIDRMLHAKTRSFLIRCGEKLTGSGAISAADDVFMLFAGELEALLDHPVDRRDLVRHRRAEMARCARLKAPSLLTSQPDVDPPEPPTEEPLSDQVLRGIPASPGRARGPVRIVRTRGDLEQVQHGDVLVCSSINVSWVALFPVIAALVTNAGGTLSHGAIIAREFAVPAVVGVASATDMLADGTLVEVDGTAGTILILPA